MVESMAKERTKEMESLGEAAKRLLAELEERRGRPGAETAPEIGRDDLDRLFSGTGNAPAVPQIAANADGQDAAKDQAAGATFSGSETASRMVRGRLPSVVYVTWAGEVFCAANDAHATSLVAAIACLHE